MDQNTSTRVPLLIPASAYSVELGVVIGSRARDVVAQDAMKHVAGYTLAIDM